MDKIEIAPDEYSINELNYIVYEAKQTLIKSFQCFGTTVVDKSSDFIPLMTQWDTPKKLLPSDLCLNNRIKTICYYADRVMEEHIHELTGLLADHSKNEYEFELIMNDDCRQFFKFLGMIKSSVKWVMINSKVMSYLITDNNFFLLNTTPTPFYKTSYLGIDIYVNSALPPYKIIAGSNKVVTLYGNSIKYIKSSHISHKLYDQYVYDNNYLFLSNFKFGINSDEMIHAKVIYENDK